MKQEQKESIEHLMFHIQKNNYKEMCDKIKVAILDKLIDISLTKPKGEEFITYYELQYIRNGINDLRTKDKEAETSAIVSVIDNIIARGDDYISKEKEIVNNK